MEVNENMFREWSRMILEDCGEELIEEITLECPRAVRPLLTEPGSFLLAAFLLLRFDDMLPTLQIQSDRMNTMVEDMRRIIQGNGGNYVANSVAAAVHAIGPVPAEDAEADDADDLDVYLVADDTEDDNLDAEAGGDIINDEAVPPG